MEAQRADEPFAVYDAFGQFTGQIQPRAVVHRDGLWHRSVHVWVTHREEGILLQKRSAQKDTFAGYWDVSCAGHLAVDEQPREGALRELEEELGCRLSANRLRFLFRVKNEQRHSAGIDREITDVYWWPAELPATAFCLNESEMDEIAYFKPAEVENMMKSSAEMSPHPAEGQKLFSFFSQIGYFVSRP